MRARRTAWAVGAAVLTGIATAPAARADVEVTPGDPGGLHGNPSVDLGAHAPGETGQGPPVPADEAPDGANPPPSGGTGSGPEVPPPPVAVVEPGQTPLLDGADPLGTWCIGPLNEGRCPQGQASPEGPPPPAGDEGPAPAVLARQAAERLVLPEPEPQHSPDLRLNDGRAATVVGEHTWFWTNRQQWRAQAERVEAGGVWAEAVAEPVRLTMHPGNGEDPVSCPGPGTPYSPTYDAHAVSPSGCDVVYQTSSAGEPDEQVSAEWTITWRVTWRGGTGDTPSQGGVLPPMASRATAEFAVAEAQALRNH